MPVEPSDSMKSFPYGKTISIARRTMKNNDMFSLIYSVIGYLIVLVLVAYLSAIIYYKYFEPKAEVIDITECVQTQTANKEEIIILDELTDDNELFETTQYEFSITQPNKETL